MSDRFLGSNGCDAAAAAFGGRERNGGFTAACPRPVIRNPADWVGHLADSGGGRRVVGWRAMVRERGHGADR